VGVGSGTVWNHLEPSRPILPFNRHKYTYFATRTLTVQKSQDETHHSCSRVARLLVGRGGLLIDLWLDRAFLRHVYIVYLRHVSFVYLHHMPPL